MNDTRSIRSALAHGWDVHALVDEDGHLNIYILNKHSNTITETDTGQGDGEGEQLARRFTTPRIEAEHSQALQSNT